MKIGIDLTSLQGPNRMRGIGYTLINFINNIPSDEQTRHVFIFYVYPENQEDALNILNLDGMNYEVREMKNRHRINKNLPGKLRLLVSTLNMLIELRDLYFGDSRIKDLDGVEVFLQTDPNQPMPHKRRLKKYLIIYDAIPYVLEWDYLWTYRTARIRGFSRKAALRVHAGRSMYAHRLRVNCRRADKLFAISEQTKKDFIKYLSVSAKKVKVIPLGVSLPDNQPTQQVRLQRYIQTSWGYIKRPLNFGPDQAPFLLFVGGADRRRKLGDLVTAFNRIRAQGYKLNLVLAGDSMQGPNNISTVEIQSALRKSSYLDDILFMGFVNDEERDWLYKHSLAFVFPSKYEGFGLPVLEAMSYGTPVIAYDNGATREVAGDIPTYVTDSLGIAEAVKLLLDMPRQEASKWHKDTERRMQTRVAQFTWHKTATRILHAMN